MSDDEGVLGNLPRSRPGRRSDKRAGGAAKAAAPRPSAPPPPPKRRAKPAAAAKPKPPPTSPPPAAEPARSGDPIGTAFRTVTGLAAGGARAANGLARGVLRRLPKP